MYGGIDSMLTTASNFLKDAPRRPLVSPITRYSQMTRHLPSLGKTLATGHANSPCQWHWSILWDYTLLPHFRLFPLAISFWVAPKFGASGSSRCLFFEVASPSNPVNLSTNLSRKTKPEGRGYNLDEIIKYEVLGVRIPKDEAKRYTSSNYPPMPDGHHNLSCAKLKQAKPKLKQCKK